MTVNEIKFTVATVTWNPGPLLDTTLRSVEEQTHHLVHHVIVDGRSTDLTLTTIRQYQERNGSHHRIPHEISLLSEPDKGLYDAMNKALQMATGDYIVFLNAGDRFHSPDTLHLIAQAAIEQSHNAATPLERKKLPSVIYGHTDIVDSSGTFLRKRHLTPPPNLDLHSFCQGMLVCHQAFFARLDIAKKTPYDTHFRFSADYDWCIRILKKADQHSLPTKNADIVVADYLDGGMTTKNHRRSLIERFHIMSNHYGRTTALKMHAYFIWRALKRL